MPSEIKELYRFRELLYAFIIRGLKAKYKNSFLGIFWSLLNPLLNVLIFAFIFTVIIKIDIKDYPIYLLCAIFPWNFFNSSLANGVVSIAEDSHLVKNTSFPIQVIPLSVVVVNFINLLIDLGILIFVLCVIGKCPNIFWLYLPFLLAMEFILVSAVAIFLSGAYIIFRDLNFILNFFLRLFFYFVPVVYTFVFIPLKLRGIYFMNPLAVVIDSFTRIFLYGVAPDFKWLAIAFLETMLLFIFCFGIFGKIKKIIPERI